MKPKYILPILCTLLFASCQESDNLPDEYTIGETIRFTGHTSQTKTRATDPEPLTTIETIYVIAPGYGTGADDQKAGFEANNGTLKEKTEAVIKRSGKGMFYTAWTEPTGVDIAAGTVDFTKDLNNFIGAHSEEKEDELKNPMLLDFVHLVGKLSLTVVKVDVQNNNQLITIKDAKIIFPAIKQIGKITIQVTKLPEVDLGVSGGELEINLNDDTGVNSIYLPPLSDSELMMYGAFTIRVSGTDYIGTLSNLSTGAINAGDHIHLTVKITDDHTALLQAINLAPWDEYPRNFYNRPYPGIWGMEDLVTLSKLINSGATEETTIDGYKLENFYQEEDGKKIIRLYTHITFDKDDEFEPIGTETNPFQNMILDGNDYSVSGITIESPEADNLGLLGVVKDITVCNLTVTKSSIEGNNHIGTFVGKSLGGLCIDQCFTQESTLVGNENIGGLIGTTAAGDVIRNCGMNIKTLSGIKNIGGIAGENLGLVGNSYTIVSGGISCSNSNAGGLIGHNTGRVENCYSSTTFTSIPEDNVGALVGSGYDVGTIYRCYWNSDCIDNAFCKMILGDNMAEDGYGLEIAPANTESFNKSTGYIVHTTNNSYYSLRDRLNGSTGLTGKDDYLRWATVGSSKLPVFGE